jgi:ABC-type lipoprotein release transport system permease subunit
MIRQSVVMTGLNLLSYQALLVTGSDDSVLMVMKNGAEAENDSSIAQDVSDAIVTAARAADPAVSVSPESSRLLSVKRPLNHDFVTIALRGVGPNAVALRDGMHKTGGKVSTLRLRPTSDAAAANIGERLKADPNLGIGVQRERDYFQGSVNGLFRTMRFFAYPVLLVMAIGAVFAGLNTMYGAVAARTREIGVARSLGDTQFAFNLVVPAALMLQGVLWAGVIGLLGGLLPAVRAGRLPIVEALRDT